MTDVEPLIRTSLDRLAPLPDAALRDWDDVRRRVGSGPAIRRRQLMLRAAVLAAALCLGAALVLVSPWSNSGNGSLAGRALAAIGTQPVLHVVAVLPVRSTLIDLKTGAATPVTEQKEIWFDGNRGLEHAIYRSGGVVVWDQLDTPQGEITRAGPRIFSRPKPTIEPALQGFVDGYREALASGAARQSGTGTIDGVPVVWLSFTLPGGDSEEVAVEVDSGRPLLVRTCSGPCSTYRITTIETISVDSADFSRPVESEPARHGASGVKNDRSAASVEVSSLPDAVPGAVWAGTSVEGLPFAAATRENWRTTFGDGAAEGWSGAQLVYGAMSSENVPDWKQPFVQVWESARPQSAYAVGPLDTNLPASKLNGRIWVPWSGPPPTPAAPLAINALTGFAFVNGVYVTVRASNGALLIAAARELHPIR